MTTEGPPFGLRTDIKHAMALLFWHDAWATHAEETGCCSLSGRRIEDIAPDMPEDGPVWEHAREAIQRIERVSGKSIEALWLAAKVTSGAKWPGTGRFGACLAFQYMGAGVSWEDDYPPIPGLVMARGESWHWDAECPYCGD